jgi:DNA modification methylase
MKNTILHGDALSVLKSLPDNHVQCVVTSPPYYGLRAYLPDGHPDKHLEIGLEESPQEFIEKLVQVFREVRRVLRPDGTLWLNIGDSYTRGGRETRDPGKSTLHPAQPKGMKRPPMPEGLKPKDLMMIPARVAIALCSDGWYLRSDIVWSKPSVMPESVGDRPTKAHEYVFLLAKNEQYFYDAEAIKEPAQNWGTRDRSNGKYTSGQPPIMNNAHHGLDNADFAAVGRNKRSVWSIPSTPFPGSHFAVMPQKLAELCVLAGSSSRACEHCGAPWQRIMEKERYLTRPIPEQAKYAFGYDGEHRTKAGRDGRSETLSRTTGVAPTCKCANNTGSGKCIVLDPFAGAGTVPLVAIRHGRDWLGVELNEEYITLINKRIETVQPNLWTEVDGGSVA